MYEDIIISRTFWCICLWIDNMIYQIWGMYVNLWDRYLDIFSKCFGISKWELKKKPLYVCWNLIENNKIVEIDDFVSVNERYWCLINIGKSNFQFISIKQ